MEKETQVNRRSFLKTAAATTASGVTLSSARASTKKATAATSEAGSANLVREGASIVDRLQGPLVPIATAFNDDDSMDLDSTCRWIDWLVKEGVKLFWTTQGTSRYFNLSDSDLLDLNRSVAQVTKGRALFIAGTPFRFSTRECIRFAESASKWGADIVMIQTDWRAKPDAEAAFRHHKEIAEASPLPLFTYILGSWPEGFLGRILDLPQYVGMKNDMGDYSDHSDFLRAARLRGRNFVPVTGGEIRPYIYGHHFGAQTFADLLICGIAPQIVIDFARYVDTGDYPSAVKIIQKYEEPMAEIFTPLGLHACFRASRWLIGKAKTYRDCFPNKTLDAREIEKVKSLLKDLELL